MDKAKEGAFVHRLPRFLLIGGNMREKNMKVIGIVVLLVLVASLGVTLGILDYKVKSYNREMGAVLDLAFYESLDAIGDAKNKLKKLDVTTSNKVKKDLLSEVYVDMVVASEHLSRLNDKDFDSTKLLNFTNQLGGFCSYLSKKLPDEEITASESEKLKTLTEILAKVEDEFVKAGQVVSLGGNLLGILNEGVDTLSGVYDAFFKTEVDYPEMIYDGPFSEGLNDREAKFLMDKKEIALEEAKGIIEKIYAGAEYASEVEGSIPTYLFSIDGGNAEISKNGGYLVSIVKEGEDGEESYSKEDAITSSKNFLEAVGYNDMQAVWVSVNSGTAYINFAYVKDGVILYPDLIKVKVSLSDLSLIGLEANNYIYNHISRTLSENRGNPQDISLKEGFEVVTKRLAVIPTEWNTEIEVYEVAGSYEGAFFYLYYDVVTLEQIKVMRVIEDENQGELIV